MYVSLSNLNGKANEKEDKIMIISNTFLACDGCCWSRNRL